MTEEHSGDSASAFLLPWLQRLGSYAGPDTLLHFTPSAGNSIDLTHAHPSGLAQLLAGRRTRLSTLLRDPAQYAQAMKAAKALRARIYELGSERGIDVGYLAAGTASWRAQGDDGRSETLTAPVLLTAVALTVHSSRDDYELQLTEQARLNPALGRHLHDQEQLPVDAAVLSSLAYGTARFDPHPVLERLRALTANVRGMTIEHHLLISTFADLGDVGHDPAVTPEHPVLEALMKSAVDGDVGEGAPVNPAPVNSTVLDHLHPSEEMLVKDADAAQQQVLNRISAGESLVVSAPPGSGQTQTAINAIAALANQGKSVLVAAERRGTVNQFVQELDELNLGSLVLQLHANISDQQLRNQLIRAIVRNEKATEPHLDSLHSNLVENRHKLQDHVKSLHNVRSRWGCSPYQAMQSLAELTSLNPAPSTAVRLKRSVLDSITDRSEVTGRLRRAAELGSFSKAATQSPWYGAKLLNRADTQTAHALALGLAEDIPRLQRELRKVAEHSQIELGDTFAEWGEQLDLLVAVRGSLDKFTPDIFDRPVTDLISATASSGWRKERGIEMSSMTRSRLRRVAKEYVRPGVHITDLHNSLLLVQQQRTTWTRYATTQRHPSVPTGLAELNNFYQTVQRKLEELADTLAKPRDSVGPLDSMSVQDLALHLDQLSEDKDTLATLPERTLLLDEMREHGLGELLDDLAEREVGHRQVGSELELAWWQSALEAMISGDDYLAMSDGESLRRLEAEYRLADNAHIASGSSRLRWGLAERWRTAIDQQQSEAASLRELLKAGTVSLGSMSSLPEELVSALMPVWAASPLMLSTILPADKRFDAVLLLDAESMSLQSAVPAIGRATQVIAFGDGQLGAPQPFNVGTDAVDAKTQGSELVSVFTALTRVLPIEGLSEIYRGVDKKLVESLSSAFYDGRLSRLPEARSLDQGTSAVVAEYLPGGTGMPSSEHGGVESVAAEVNRVVDLVFEHVRRRPGQSLAVITASTRHAARVAEAIRLHLADYPWAADFFQPSKDSFRVVPVERAAGLVRDNIIFSLGYGRTPHGRALHNFGPLSQPDGRGRFLTAMTRARHGLHILSCFRPEDLDPSRLEFGAHDFYELLASRLGGAVEDRQESSSGNGAEDAAEAPASVLDDDPLVADLVDRLAARGARIWDTFEGELDIAATSGALTAEPHSDRPPIAIESDGTERYRQMSVRERSRLRPQLLERLGWRAMPLWTIEVFTDPEACADLVGTYLGLDPRPTDAASAESRDEIEQRPIEEPVSVEGEADRAQDSHAQSPEEDVVTESPEVTVEPNEKQSAADSAESVLPTLGATDSPQAWGDKEEDRDSWLREQRPPHWG